jgi:hypothetical protein
MMRVLNNRGLKIVVIALLLTAAGFSQSDQKPASLDTNRASADSADTYRIDVMIREMQDGKPISSRNYSTLIRDGRYIAPRTIRVGSRLPVQTPGQGTNYLDVGTNLTLRAWRMEGQLILSMAVEVSSIAPVDPASNVKVAELPVMRQLRTDQEAAIPLGKATLFNSIDDPNSNHKFQIEVTAIKEKI